MATKTMILRPIGMESTNISNITLYPPTELNNAHMLINENIADDDSTYIILNINSDATHSFSYKKPIDMIQITNVVVKIRCKVEVKSDRTHLTWGLTTSPEESYDKFGNTTLTSSEYTDYNLSNNNTVINSFISQLQNSQSLDFIVYTGVANSSVKSTYRITQLYVEITYEADDTIVPTSNIYIKSNGTWIPQSNIQIYSFSNGAWSLTDESEFFDGQRYQLYL